MGIDVSVFAERRRQGRWEPIAKRKDGSFYCEENKQMLARFLGSIKDLHYGFPPEMSNELRPWMGNCKKRDVAWASGEELARWKHGAAGREKYSSNIPGFINRDIPSLLELGAPEDVRFIFVFSV